ncbi:MAG: alanine racemase [Alphaproteobacteria bacterium]|nr:alanine racemase [Alphaproteobacteria bacterium]
MPLGRLTIDLEAVAANWRLLRDRVQPAECAAVVKADAYGLGMAPVVRALADAGCRTFFVATLEEAVALRLQLPDVTVGMLSDRVEPQVRDLTAHRITPVLNHPGDVTAWRRRGAPARAWLHVDTGMHRLGLSPEEWRALLAERPDWREYGIGGVMSHFACADERDHPLNAYQRDAARAAARAAGLPLSLGNSPGIFLGEAYRGDLVRPGMALYGLNPKPYAANPMRPVVRLEAQVLQVREVTAAGTAGYGATAAVRPGQTLATVGLGYADGLLRSLSGRGFLYFAGVAAPIVGRVSMDSIIVDVSRLSPKPAPGDWAEVIGPNHPPDDLADKAGTIGYEILTSLGARYARTYLPAGSVS